MAVPYLKAQTNMLEGDIPLISGTVKFALLQSGYTPDQDNHEFFSDLTNEVTQPNYPAGGITLSNKVIVEEPGNNRVYFDNTADLVATAVGGTITARYGVFYLDTGVTTTSPLLSYQDFGSDVSATDGDLTFTPDAAGIYRLTIV